MVEEFSTVSSILDKFADWKTKFEEDYNDAYVGLCLPKLLSPLIKVELIDWNPLEVNLCYYRLPYMVMHMHIRW